jgi:uncharacterized membrane protein YkoI
MTKRTKVAVAAVSALALAAGGVGVAAATGGDDERPITGSDLERAREAALAHTGGGEVTETEVGDEESRYEVEVTRPNGSQVDVQLDRAFDVVGDEADGETERGDDAD